METTSRVKDVAGRSGKDKSSRGYFTRGNEYREQLT